MKTRQLLLTAATASLTLLAASCHDDDHDSGGTDTVSALAAEQIAGSTNDTAEPIDLNSRVLSLMDTDETTSPVPVN
jgi:hypothetical protein